MRGAIAIGAMLAVLAAIAGCGGGSGGDTTEAPTTGVPLADGTCKADPAAQEKRDAELKSGKITAKEAGIGRITELRTCEVEGNAIGLKKALCSHDAAQLLKEGTISRQQAAQLEDFQKRAEC